MKILAITQARIGSRRLFKKILLKVKSKSLLEIHLERIMKSKKINKLMLATTNELHVEKITKICKKLDVNYYKGSTNNVLDRFYNASKDENPDWIVRLTSDCPLIDPELIDKIIDYVVSQDVDYGSNILIEKFPDGQDVEVFKFSALKKAWENAKLQSDKEHVTTFIRNNSDFNKKKLFKAVNYLSKKDFSKIRMTVDHPEDFELIKILINNLGLDKSWFEYTHYIINNNLQKINSDITRNEGLIKSLSND
tara:strand:- start:28463 stop:29215 length:753 start_codon:yes stop_codon:yes gene_type:complete